MTANLAPCLAIVHVENPHRRGIHLWIPLFLLWIPLLLIAPLVLLVILCACIAWRISFAQTVGSFWRLLCSLPGTDVRVCADGNRVTVRIV
jgi:hypothetical protein